MINDFVIKECSVYQVCKYAKYANDKWTQMQKSPQNSKDSSYIL